MTSDLQWQQLVLRPVGLSTGTLAPFPGTAQYRDEFDTDPNSRGILRRGFPGPRVPRVPGNRYTKPPYPLNMHCDFHLSTLLCTPHAAKKTQRAEGGPVCHHAVAAGVLDDFEIDFLR